MRREVRHRGGLERRAPAELGVAVRRRSRRVPGPRTSRLHRTRRDRDASRRRPLLPSLVWSPRTHVRGVASRRIGRSRRLLVSRCVALDARAPPPPRRRIRRARAASASPVRPAATAMATRAGDPALYVATQDGKVFAVRSAGEPATVLDLTGQVRPAASRGCSGSRSRPTARSSTRTTRARPRARRCSTSTRWSTGGPTRRHAAARAHGAATAGEPQRRPARVRSRRLLYLGLGDGGGAGDRGSGHAPGGNGQSLDTCSARSCASTRGRRAGRAYTVPADNPVRRIERAARDLRLRAAQPVAVLVRPRDRRPLDRRRRPERVRGGRRALRRRRSPARTSAGTSSRARTRTASGPDDRRR